MPRRGRRFSSRDRQIFDPDPPEPAHSFAQQIIVLRDQKNQPNHPRGLSVRLSAEGDRDGASNVHVHVQRNAHCDRFRFLLPESGIGHLDSELFSADRFRFDSRNRKSGRRESGPGKDAGVWNCISSGLDPYAILSRTTSRTFTLVPAIHAIPRSSSSIRVVKAAVMSIFCFSLRPAFAGQTKRRRPPTAPVPPDALRSSAADRDRCADCWPWSRPSLPVRRTRHRPGRRRRSRYSRWSPVRTA